MNILLNKILNTTLFKTKTWVVSSTYKIYGRFSHALIINFQTTTILLQMAIIDGHD